MWMKEAVVLENESLPPPSFAGAIIESHQFVHARATPTPPPQQQQRRPMRLPACLPLLPWKGSTRPDDTTTDRPKGLL